MALTLGKGGLGRADFNPKPKTLASGLPGPAWPSSSDESSILTLDAFGGVVTPLGAGGADSNTELIRISDPLPRNELSSVSIQI